MQAFIGLAEASAGGLATLSSGGLAAPIGWPVLVHGLDQFIAGVSTAITGKHRVTLTEQLLQTTDMPSEWASFPNDVLSISGTLGGSAIVRASRLVVFPSFNLSPEAMIETIDPHPIRFSQNSIKKRFRNGMTIDDLVNSLRKGNIGPNEIEAIKDNEKK